MGMQYFMANRSIGKVTVGGRKELNPPGLNGYREVTQTTRPGVILSGIEYYRDVQASTFLHLKDELLDWPAETG
ncbi:MAG TPA: hypothetical protein VJM31_12500 [Vicinamibacterales bacterium]|nr:hypothetical protein [Vicinamibacterales bacterium]